MNLQICTRPGRVEIHASEVDLHAEIDELVDVNFVRAQEKGLAFGAELELPTPCVVRTDPTRLRQILHNLLGNAIKFTDTGRIGLRVRHTGFGHFQFVVQDTGMGIAPEDLPHIFDAFWRAKSAHGRNTAGAGLGLHLAQELTRAMGGSIRCESQPGVGTTFELNLPLPEIAPAPPAAARGTWSTTQATEAGVPVLLAEDNEVNALVVETMLERNGCSVQRVSDGAEAVRLATVAGPQRPSVVLMDCQMPVLDGVEATRRIRAAEQELGLARVPVVALTANSALDDKLQCRRAGMDYFLGKPFTEDELLAALAACLQLGKPRPRPAPAPRAPATR